MIYHPLGLTLARTNMSSDSLILFENKTEAEDFLPEREIKLVQIRGVRKAMVRLGDRIFVFDPLCPHQDYPLAQGLVNPRGEVVCKWHSYRFSLHTGAEAEARCSTLKVRQIQMTEQGTYVY